MKKCILVFFLTLSSYAWSGYDANMRGVVKHVAVYTGGDYIYSPWKINLQIILVVIQHISLFLNLCHMSVGKRYSLDF